MNGNIKGWAVTLAGTGINLALGVLYTWSVFASALAEQFHWSKTQASFPYVVACATFALMMVPAGRLLDRFGPRWIASLGGIMAGGGLILSSFTNSYYMLMLSFGVITGMGIGMGYSAATPAAVKWFPPEKKGLISGIVVAGFGLASLYIAPMTNAIITQFGIESAFRVEGILFLVAIAAFAQILGIPLTAKADGHPAGQAAQIKAAVNYTWKEMLKKQDFYLLWLMYAAGASAGLMIIGQLSSISKIQVGISWGYAMVALLAIFNASGRVLAGWLSDKIGRTPTLRIFFILQALNMFAFQYYSSAQLLAFGTAIAGLGYGSLLSLFPSATYDSFGTKYAGVNYGLVFTAWGIGGVFGPLMGGAVVDATHTYSLAYNISSLLCLAAVVLTLFLKKRVKAA
ncbi:MAG: putative MFS-type transporter YhjX [Candidatus Dichloromethanomonas elyunquensis]|nr:MAG: putative MFS-type transporter YhjX [Candidatus Dichloromethanomonas elyunquensis]